MVPTLVLAVVGSAQDTLLLLDLVKTDRVVAAEI